MKNKVLALILALSMTFSLVLTGCSSSGDASGDSSGAGNGSSTAAMIMVGLSMGSEETSGEAGEVLKSGLEKAGYTVELAYADSGSQQSKQISAMVDDGAKVLIVDAVDTQEAAKTLESIMVDVSDVAVISYRDPLDSTASTTYVGRDYYEMGKQEAQHIAERLLLDTRSDSITLEMVAGKGTSADQAIEGALEVLQPYIDSGIVTISSGNTTASACQTDDAGEWAETMFTTTYAEQELRAILCLGEGQAVEVVDAIQTKYPGTIYPVVVGSDCSPETLQYMSKNLLDMVSFCDASALVDKTAETIQTVLSGSGIEKEYLLENTAVTTENYVELMVDSGIYTANNDGTFTKN